MKKFLLYFISSFIIATCITQGQNYADPPDHPRPTYGIYGGGLFNMHTADFKGFEEIPSCCPGYETGSGFGAAGGLMFTFPLSKELDMVLKGGFNSLSGKLSRTEGVTVSDENGNAVQGEFEHTIEATLNEAALTPIIAYKLNNSFRLNAGLRLGMLLDPTMTQIEKVASPDFGQFIDTKSPTRNEYSGEIPDAASIEAALVVGLSYDLPINAASTLYLSPEVYYSYSFIPVSSQVDSWNVSSIQGGIAMKYAPRRVIPPTPPPPPPPPPPLPPPPPPPTAPVLDATIAAVGVEENGAENKFSALKVEEFLYTRMHPILNYVFFDHNSNAIPNRYTRISENEKDDFSVNKLYNLKTMEVYHHLLNIVGKRLAYYPQSQITLIGCNSGKDEEKGNTALSGARAKEIKDFLVREWGIDGNRIQIKSQNLPDIASNQTLTEGDEENRRVEIIANLPQIFEPMTVRDTLREANPPHIRFKSDIKSEMGIKDWQVITLQNGKSLRVFSGTGTPPKQIDWNLQKEDEQAFIPRFDSPLQYKLVVTDFDNKKWESQVQTLPVEQLTIEKKMFEMMDDKEIDRFSLILFGFNQYQLNDDNRKIAIAAKDRIRRGSTVAIRGYSDVLGEEDHNLKLSQQRAYEAAKAMEVDTKNAQGIGEGVLLFDNDMPEGRFYCRTVNIEIVTPIE